MTIPILEKVRFEDKSTKYNKEGHFIILKYPVIEKKFCELIHTSQHNNNKNF